MNKSKCFQAVVIYPGAKTHCLHMRNCLPRVYSAVFVLFSGVDKMCNVATR